LNNTQKFTEYIDKLITNDIKYFIVTKGRIKMNYERMRTVDAPYKLWIGAMNPFNEHRHADFEIACCFAGGFEIKADNKIYKVKPNEIILIPPMVAHASASLAEKGTKAVCAIFGASFFGNSSSLYRNLVPETTVIVLSDENKACVKISKLLDEMIYNLRNQSITSDLLNKGNLYKLAAYIFEELSSHDKNFDTLDRDISKIANIDKALELIYSDYMRDVSVEEAAQAAGYSKSNFCKIFKNVVGESFHKTLNIQRINTSYAMLTETSMQISDIAAEVGFHETKTYCRVFKEITGLTPGEYRKIKL